MLELTSLLGFAILLVLFVIVFGMFVYLLIDTSDPPCLVVEGTIKNNINKSLGNDFDSTIYDSDCEEGINTDKNMIEEALKRRDLNTTGDGV